MRTKSKTTLTSFIGLIIILCSVMSFQASAQKKSATLKIGTYDSRLIIFAWSRTDALKQHMIKIKQQNDSATQAKDTAKLREVAIGAMSFQHLLHQMVFSTGSVAFYMNVIKDKLPALAKQEGVSIIVSKYELNYSDPSFETVDLTSKVAALFQPKENIDKMAAEMTRQAPVPIEEMTIESEMIDQYCGMFAKK